MFDDFLENLRKLDGQQVSVPIHADEDGYFDKECPSELCRSPFKVFADDWRNIVRDEEVFCPICGTSSTSDQFAHSDHVQLARKQGIKHFKGLVHNVLTDGAEDFNRCNQRTNL
jgi:hypothetical protein